MWSIEDLYNQRENSFNIVRLPIPLNSFKNSNKRSKFDIFSLSFAFTIRLTLTLRLCGLPTARQWDDRVTSNNLIRCIYVYRIKEGRLQYRPPVYRILRGIHNSSCGFMLFPCHNQGPLSLPKGPRHTDMNFDIREKSNLRSFIKFCIKSNAQLTDYNFTNSLRFVNDSRQNSERVFFTFTQIVRK